jgi:predicted transcriptional regulator of viral defense system
MEKAAHFDRETCRWIVLGEASDVHRSKDERLVIETLRSSGPLNIKVIMDATGIARNKLDLLLGRMVKSGTVEKPERGVYALPPEPTAEEENLQ